MKREYKKFFLWILVSIVWTAAWIYLFPDILDSKAGFLFAFLPWFAHGFLLAALYSVIREAFWKQLAQKYKWEYTHDKDITREKGLLFQLGHSQMALHGLRGDYHNQPLHIFEYEYTEGAGRSARRNSFTVFEIKFTGTFPHLYLDYKKNQYSNKPGSPESMAHIPVPKEFSDKFNFYAPKEYEIETLEIFTPDIFALLLDLNWSHDMEFVDGELIIYRNAHFTNLADLEAELVKTQKFIDVLAPLLNRLKLTQIGDISPLISSGKRV